MGVCNSTKKEENHDMNILKKSKYTLKRTSTFAKGEMFFGKIDRSEYNFLI
jgi:hypothetical protein